MKYLAIFKDSLREALDSKIIYFMFVLSLVVVGFIGSIRFRPMPVQEQLETITRVTNWAFGKLTQGKGPQFGIADFEQTNHATEPWKGTYRFVYQIIAPDAAALAELRKNGLVPGPLQLQAQLAQHIPWVDQMTVKDLPSTEPNAARYQVEIESTKIKDRRQWVHEPALFFGAVPVSLAQGPLSSLLSLIVDTLIGGFGAAITMLISIVITAFFIPNMLRKGTIDLLLAKPISRVGLLLYKFLGGMSFMLLNTAVIMAGLFVVIGLQTDIWLTSLLMCIGIFTFQFAIFYSLSTLTAVTTRSPIVAILAAVALWGVLSVFGWTFRAIDKVRPEKLTGTLQGVTSPIPDWVFTGFDAAHMILPHYKDLDVLSTRLIQQDMVDPNSPDAKKLDEHMDTIRWERSIPITLAFIAIMLGLSCWWFARRDY